jgi:4'-phosphopantetheinyl transferase
VERRIRCRLCRAAAIRQHERMRTTLGHDVASIASALDNDTIHVWLLPYQRSMQRHPLRALLGVYLGLPVDAVVLVNGEHGRPELVAPWNQLLQFNWSHSGDKAVIAVARGVVPGIDIEQIRPRPRAMQLARRFFHPDEVAALAALDTAELECRFLELWTGKEAVLKALGRGVAFGLHRLLLKVSRGESGLLWLDEGDAKTWQLKRLAVDADYVASLAWRGSSRTVDIRTLAESG